VRPHWLVVVEAGLGGLTLDDLAYERLEYWTRDPDDPRSRVTLRHLLSFVSGASIADGGVIVLARGKLWRCRTGCAACNVLCMALHNVQA
jgi:hypothetical protein